MKIMILFCFVLLQMSSGSTLRELYLESKTKNYVALSPAEFEMARSLFHHVLKGNISTKESTDSMKALDLSIVTLDQNNIVLIDNLKRGWGFYVIRHHMQVNNLLSIPHRYFDLGTAKIGYKLMREHPYRAIAFNTVHRKVLDVAHVKYTLFNAFHLAFSQQYPEEKIYQLHGFSNNSRSTDEAKEVHAIVSTTTLPTRQSKNISACINRLKYQAKHFGDDVFELGGTTNEQAILLKSDGYKNFIHIEMNKELRDALKQDTLLRNKIQGCLL